MLLMVRVDLIAGLLKVLVPFKMFSNGRTFVPDGVRYSAFSIGEVAGALMISPHCMKKKEDFQHIISRSFRI